MQDRRRFLLGSGAALLLPWRARGAVLGELPMPFTLGVASGYPGADTAVLWTRLAPEPLAPGGGMPPVVVPVQWEIAEDPGFRRIASSGVTHATPEWAHSVHVEPAGLAGDREYWYRFRVGRHLSPAGRLRTSPRPGAQAASLRLAVASCQNYEQGHYAAYRHLAASAPDLVLHLGDYIYEGGRARTSVRPHASAEVYTLDDYRQRHAQYRLDPLLQAAHAAAPWLFMWDDHEVDNDYAGDESEEADDPALFLQRRANAYRAYYEHLPLPRRAVPFGPSMRLHATRTHGDLVSLLLLDQRQFRSPQACPPPGRSGGRAVADCAELAREDRTMLGARQERWAAAQLAATRSRWTLLGQGTVMAQIDQQPGEGTAWYTDSWAGYPAARRRLLGDMRAARVANPVVLSGDIHAFGVAGLRERAGDPGSARVAPEFIVSSISSNSLAPSLFDAWRAESAELSMLEARHRGYLALDVTPQRLVVDMIAVERQADAGSPCRLLARHVVEAGSPDVQAG